MALKKHERIFTCLGISLVSLFLLFHFPMSRAGSFSSEQAEKALRHREIHGSTSDVPLNSVFFSSIRSRAHKVPEGLQLTSSDLHYLGKCRKAMSHGLLYLPYPGQMAHHPLCHHSKVSSEAKKLRHEELQKCWPSNILKLMTLKVSQHLLTTGHYVWSWSTPN